MYVNKQCTMYNVKYEGMYVYNVFASLGNNCVSTALMHSTQWKIFSLHKEHMQFSHLYGLRAMSVMKHTSQVTYLLVSICVSAAIHSFFSGLV